MSVIVAHTGQCKVDGLSVWWKQEEDLWTLRLSGAMRLGEGRALFDSILDFIDQKAQKVIVDLGEVRLADSAALGSLVVVAAKMGNRVRFIRINERLNSVLVVCKLYTLNCFNDEEASAPEQIVE